MVNEKFEDKLVTLLDKLQKNQPSLGGGRIGRKGGKSSDYDIDFPTLSGPKIISRAVLRQYAEDLKKALLEDVSDLIDKKIDERMKLHLNKRH